MDLASRMIWRFGCPMKLDTSSFSVKSESPVSHFCHLTSFAKETKETNFSVKSSWEVRWIIMFQKDVVCGLKMTFQCWILFITITIQRATAHCVLLRHYYSVDFPRWFDRKISFFSLLCKTWKLEKKVVKWQKFKTALCDLTEKLFLLNFVSLQFWTEISYQSGSQIHAWILLNFFFYCISFHSSFCRTSPFHREWLVLISILMI